MKKIIKTISVFSLLCLSFSCTKDEIDPVVPEAVVSSVPSKGLTARITTDQRLKNLSGYPIGIETEYSVISSGNSTALDLLKNEYNSMDVRLYGGEVYTGTIDANNWGTLSFANPDNLFNFAKNNGYSRFHGHCLVYHVGLANGQDSYIQNHNTAQFEAIIKTHIESIVNHYKAMGMANRSYDVINEVIDDVTTGYRNTVFRQKYLTDADYNQFIIKCFKWAKAADPTAKMFYNDYNWENSDGLKRQRIVNLVNIIKAPANNIIVNGVSTPIIDGVGLQSHVGTNNFGTGNDFTNALTAAKGTGLLVHISELDVSINVQDQTEAANPFNEALKQKQADVFRRIPQIYYNTVPAAQRFGITMWDLNDANSWVPKYLRASHYDKATMYDDNYNKKPGYWGFATGLAGYTLLPTNQSFTITPLSTTNVIFASGANATLGTNGYSGNNNQKWTLDHQGNGVYRIKNNGTGGYISGAAGATANGTALISNTALDNSQLVKITPLDNGIYSLIVGTNQGFDRNASNGNMQFYGYGAGANQKMKLEIR
jgi:endo-1,4-beta-xylanase